MSSDLDVLAPGTGVDLVRWPAQAERRAGCAAEGIPCLLLVAPGERPPVIADGEDWVYASADERDVAFRIDALRRSPRRARTSEVNLVPDGLSPVEHRVATRLLASGGSLVPRVDLPVDDLDDVVARLRAVLTGSGWCLHVVGTAGFVAERVPGAAP